MTRLSNFRGIILDFDGVLADSEPYHFKAYDQVFRKYGHSLDPEEYWLEFTSKGKGIAGEIERHNLKMDVDPKDMRKQKFEIYSKFCRNGEIKLFPGAFSFIETASKFYCLSIASGSWENDIRTILSHAGANHFFPLVLGKESTEREKPHPDIFLKAAIQMKLKPTECVVIEDALKGLYAAQNAGMYCVIVRNRLNATIDFEEADLVVENLAVLTSKLEGK